MSENTDCKKIADYDSPTNQANLGLTYFVRDRVADLATGGLVHWSSNRLRDQRPEYRTCAS